MVHYCGSLPNDLSGQARPLIFLVSWANAQELAELLDKPRTLQWFRQERCRNQRESLHIVVDVTNYICVTTMRFHLGSICSQVFVGVSQCRQSCAEWFGPDKGV